MHWIHFQGQVAVEIEPSLPSSDESQKFRSAEELRRCMRLGRVPLTAPLTVSRWAGRQGQRMLRRIKRRASGADAAGRPATVVARRQCLHDVIADADAHTRRRRAPAP